VTGAKVRSVRNLEAVRVVERASMPVGTVPPTVDDATFAAFLQHHEGAIRGLLRRLCTSAADVDDILQDTLTKVWRLRASFDPRQNGGAWLQQAAFRSFCDHRRRERQKPPTHGCDDAIAAPDVPLAIDGRDEIRHRLNALSPIERTLVVEFHAHGRSLRDLAAAHALSINTVKSHLHRARRKLQRHPEDS